MTIDSFEEAKTYRAEQLQRIESIDAAIEAIQSSESGLVETEEFLLRKVDFREKLALQTTCRCRASDWSTVYLLLPKSDAQQENLSSDLEELVSDTRFDGFVVLDFSSSGSDEKADTEYSRLFPGIHSNLLVADSIFQVKTCRVYRNSLISRTFVGSHAVVMNCGQVAGPESGSTYDCGELSIMVGPESGGGRELLLTPESTMMDVTPQFSCHEDKADSDSLMKYSVISDGCVVHDTATVQNVLLYPLSSIKVASSVKNATLYPQATITNASTVSNVLMQWNTSISDNSKINNVMMMEESHCGPSSIVESAVMGPDTHASAGEIHASVFGPNTNAHHQSLLIGALWPLGRGNIGYGANVGSNHTGRLPDQEATVGEGTFWGLSCVVKFPVDLTWSPYSIVAAGTRLSPQRVCMPFSLIMENDQGKSEIIPAWVLQSSPYTLARNDKKYATRRKAKRHSSYTGWGMFRPVIIDMCRLARESLRDDVVEGIGSNVLTDRGKSVGIKAYTNCIQRYVLEGLFKWVTKEERNLDAVSSEFYDNKEEKIALVWELFPDFHTVAWPSFPWDAPESSVNEWDYQRGVILLEFSPGDSSDVGSWLKKLLTQYVELETDFAARIRKCKARDHTRGDSIIPGYSDFHVASDSDPVIVEANRKVEEISRLVETLIAKIGN